MTSMAYGSILFFCRQLLYLGCGLIGVESVFLVLVSLDMRARPKGSRQNHELAEYFDVADLLHGAS